MALGWSKSRTSPIGIDFGADTLKLLQIMPSSPPQLTAAAAVVMPDHTRRDPASRGEFLAEALKTALKQQPFKGRRCVISLPAYQTMVHNFQIATNEHENLTQAVEMQLRQRLNVDPSRMVVRIFEVGQVVRDGVNKREVVVMAAAKESVMKYIEAAQRAKLDVVGVECEAHALLAAFGTMIHNNQEQHATDPDALCFIDIGGGVTKVVIAHGREMVFAKTINAGGDHITRQLAQAKSLDFEEARKLRMGGSVGGDNQDGAPPVAAAASTGLPGLDAQTDFRTAATAPPATDPDPGTDTVDSIIDELQLCLRYYASLFPRRPVSKLVFLGGESNNVKTCQTIARAVRIGAQLGDPMARMVTLGRGLAAGVDVNKPQPGWAVPLGLCLKEPDAA